MYPKDFPLKDSQVERLRMKVNQEKSDWIRHIETKVTEKKGQMNKLLQKPKEFGEIKVNKVWNNLNLRKSIFLRDEIDVKVVQESGALWVKIAENANKVMRFDSIEMDFRADKEEILTYDGMFGLWAVMIDGYDDEEQQPIRTIINPLLCYGDPRNWRGSKMRFFWTQIEKRVEELESDPTYFNTDKIKAKEGAKSHEIEEFQRARNSANRTTHIYSTEWLVHIINHITSLDGKLYLSTWDIDCNVLFRLIELRTLTNKERKRPDKIDLGVILYRAKPIPFSFFGASIFDEVEQYQDLATALVNLQRLQAERVGQWPNTYINEQLGMDIDAISNKPIAGAKIPYSPDIMNPNLDARSGIFVEPPEQISQFPTQMRQEVDQLMNETVGYNSSITSGISPSGSQTKAEFQTLQANINEQLGMINDNYLDSDRKYFTSHLKAYALNMPKTARKSIVLFEDDKQDSYSFKKSDFVPKGKIQVYVTSKVQEDIRDKQDFAILSTTIQTVLPNLEQGSTKFYETLRLYIDKSGVKGMKGISLFPLTETEVKAHAIVEAINNEEYDEEIFWPEGTDNFTEILEIIENAVDNEYKDKAILDYSFMREKVKQITPEQPKQMAVWNAQSNAMTANMLASQQNQTPSIWQIK